MRLALVADTHPPFEDKRALSVVYQIIEDAQPDELIHLGDGADFYGLSKYDKDPTRALNIQSDIEAARAINKQLALAAGSARKRYIPGNHEARLTRYLHAHPEIAGLRALELQHLLRFDDDGWELAGQYIEYCAGKLHLTHGGRVSKLSAYSARAMIDDLGGQKSCMMGHTHRVGAYYQRGSLYDVAGYEIGCLCSFDTYKQFPNWQRGMAIVEIIGRRFWVELIPIKAPGKRKRLAFWRGKEYKA